MDIWDPKIGDTDVDVKHEEEDEHDRYAIAIFHNKRVVGHAPKNFCKLFYHFLLLPGCSIGVEVTGKRVNRGSGYGMEIPVCYRITGPEKAKSWIKNNITKALDAVSKKIEHCMK